MASVENFRQQLPDTKLPEKQGQFRSFGNATLEQKSPLAAVASPGVDEKSSSAVKERGVLLVGPKVDNEFADKTIFVAKLHEDSSKSTHTKSSNGKVMKGIGLVLAGAVGAVALTGCEGLPPDSPTTPQSPEDSSSPSHTLASEMSPRERSDANDEINRTLLFLHDQLVHAYRGETTHHPDRRFVDGREITLDYDTKPSESAVETTEIIINSGRVKASGLSIVSRTIDNGQVIAVDSYTITQQEDGWFGEEFKQHLNAKGKLVQDKTGHKRWSTLSGQSLPAMSKTDFINYEEGQLTRRVDKIIGQ